METIKKYTMEQLKAVKPILSENEQLSIIAGRFELGGYYFFTREEMLEMFENETLFPSAFENKFFEDKEKSTKDHIVYIRYWYISISDYEQVMRSKYSFSNPQGGGSIVIPSGGSHVNENGTMTQEEIAIQSASIAANLCETFYSFARTETIEQGYSIIAHDTFLSRYQSSIQTVVENILNSGKTNVEDRYISYRGMHKVSITISNNYGISNEIFYNFI